MLVWGKARAGRSAAASNTHTARPQPIAAAPRSSAPARAGGGTGGSSGPTRGRRRPRTSPLLPSSPSRAGMRLPAGLCSRTAPRCAVGWLLSAPGAQRGRHWLCCPEQGCFAHSAAHLPAPRRARACKHEETSSIEQRCDGCSGMSPFCGQNCVWK